MSQEGSITRPEYDGSATDTLDPTTYQELREIATRYPEARSGLLPMLHLVQSVQGQITPEGIEACAHILDISTAEVSGVATFYTMYKRRPMGDYHVGVCTNTLCAVLGGDAIFERLKEHLDVGNDETTADGKITLEHVECNAACDYAPVVMVNWEFMDNVTPQSATQLVDDLREGREVRSTRGPRITTWREVERVLAGFPDDLAHEGPAAGPASLVGLEIARERGWTAPEGGTRERPSEAGGDATPGSKTGAAQQADTGRAESETEQERTAGTAQDDEAQGEDAPRTEGKGEDRG